MRICLLDLEQTIIDDWENKNLLLEHVDVIKSHAQHADALGLMSFAVWDEKDLSVFNRVMRKPLENLLGRDFDDRFVFTKDKLLSLTKQVSVMKGLSKEDFDDFFMRKEVLLHFLCIHGAFPSTELVLLDDTVSNTVIDCHTHHTRVQSINIIQACAPQVRTKGPAGQH